MSWPHFTKTITVGAGNKGIRLEVNGSGETVNLTPGTGAWYGDGSAAHDWAQILQVALNTHTGLGGHTFTVTLLQTGFLRISFSNLGATFSLLLSHVGTTIDVNTFGFAAATYTDSGLVITSPYVVGSAWFPNRPATADHEWSRMIGASFEPVGASSINTVKFGEWVMRPCSFEYVESVRVLDQWAGTSAFATACGTSTLDPNVDFESNLWEWLWAGDAIYYHPSGTGSATRDGPYYMAGNVTDLAELIEVQVQRGAFCRVLVPLKRD